MSPDVIFGLIGLFAAFVFAAGAFFGLRSLFRRARSRMQKRAKVSRRPAATGGFRWIRSFGRLELHLGWLGLALLLAAAFSYLAETQRPHPDPYSHRAVLTLDWWGYPLEANAHTRSTIVTGDLFSIVLRPLDSEPVQGQAAQSEAAELWAAGSGGLLISSRDSGRTWRQAPISAGDPYVLRDGRRDAATAQDAAQTGVPNREEIEAGIDFEIRGLTDRRAQNQNLLDSLYQDEKNAVEKLSIDPKLWSLLQAQSGSRPEVLSKETGIPAAEIADFQRRFGEISRVREDIASIDRRIAELEAGRQPAQVPASDAPPVAEPLRPALTPEDHVTRGLRSIAFVGERGWAVGDHGVIVETWDGGGTWSLTAVGFDGDRLYDIAFAPDGRTGWIVGTPGLFVTDDGGDSWRPQPVAGAEGIELRFVAVVAAPTRLGYWVVAGGAEGYLLVSENGGRDWTYLEINDSSGLNAASLYPFETGTQDGRSDLGLIVVGEAGAFTAAAATIQRDYSTVIDEPSEEVYGLAGERALNGIWMDGTPGTFWTVGSQGLVIRGAYGDDPQEPPTALEVLQPGPGLTADFHDIVFGRDGRQGWIVGADGTLLRSADAGRSWTRVAYGKSSILSAMTAQPDTALTELFSVEGEDLTLAPDGGTGDLEALNGSHGTYPAPWYYLSWALVLGFAGLAIRPQSPPPARPGIDDRGVADRPLEHGDRDPLNFGAIAKAISNFLINENTEPPLTIAISGDWGCGKSSILNLVKHNLRAARRRPIWFNAWHHQNAESLLAALLETIRREAIPPWWSPAGWIFRAHLLRVRFRRDPVWLSVLLLLCVFAAGHFFVVSPLDLVPYYKSMLGGLLGGGSELTGNLADSSPLIAGAIGGIGLWLKLKSSFGASGFSLARLVGGGGIRADDIRSRVGFRHQFAREFKDVTEALGRMHMVIMIDDLDRCQAKNIMETLELMNFLVTSGKCFILVGLAPKQVMKLIKGELEGDTDPKDYLEKLINIEIPVPVLKPEDRSKLISEFVNQDKTEQASQADRTRLRSMVLSVAFVALLVGGVGYLGHYMGEHIEPDVDRFLAQTATAPEPEKENDVMQVVLVGPNGERLPLSSQPEASSPPETGDAAAPADAGGGATETPYAPPVDATGWGVEAAPAPKAVLLAGKTGSGSSVPTILLWSLALIICVFTAIEQMRRSAVGVVQDSHTFQEALSSWDVLIQHGNATPRALKRFMNKLRFLAMRQRALLDGDAPAGPQALQQPAAIPEPALVALSAIENFDPKLLDTLGSEKGFQQILGQVEEPGLKKRLGEADPYATFPWPRLVERYRRLGTVVRTELEESRNDQAKGNGALA